MSDALRQTVFDLWRIIAQGGWIMGAIFLAGQLGWFLILERWWTFRKMDGKPHRFLGGAGKTHVGATRTGAVEAEHSISFVLYLTARKAISH